MSHARIAPSSRKGILIRGPIVTAMSLFERAERWLGHDPDPETRAEIQRIVDAARSGDDAARRELQERFAGPLEFGTAGLRGLLGGGESRMNRAVVRRTSFGLGSYLMEVAPARAREKGVVIGYDGRRMGKVFAEDTARVLAAIGIPSRLTRRPSPTPLTAYAGKVLDAAASVMVTASHNPPAYNGYKVYWDNGAQIIPPRDTGIAAAIERAPDADRVPLMDDAEAISRGLISLLPDAIEEQYLAAIAALSVRADGDRSIPIVYTPLHGVGERLTREALTRAGFTRVLTVPEQAEPNGDFPTVAFPNPEEKGALDLAFALADREGTDLVIANDPDVDRLAIAVRGPDKKFVQLTGNQVGALLGHYVITEGKDQAAGRLVLASLVSSPMLGAIARAHGVHYEETLTGFKWITNRAMDLERSEGLRFVYGFEEALGYTVGTVVRDKDGISAALVAAELAAVMRAEDKTLLDRLEDLARRYGLFVSGQKAITMPGADGLSAIGAIMSALRRERPSHVGSAKVTAFTDYKARIRVKDGVESPIDSPPSNVVVLDLEGGSRIIARPSGTEPKIKFYFDLREEMREGEPVRAAEERANATMKALMDAFSALTGGAAP